MQTTVTRFKSDEEDTRDINENIQKMSQSRSTAFDYENIPI